jgi:hypothetical protein
VKSNSKCKRQNEKFLRSIVGLLILLFFVSFLSPSARAQAAPVAERPLETAGDMEPDALAGVLQRVGLNPEDFGGKVVAAKPGAAKKEDEGKSEEERAAEAASAEEARVAALTPEERAAEDAEAERVAALSPEEREAELLAQGQEAERRAALTVEERAAEDEEANHQAQIANSQPEKVKKLETDLTAATAERETLKEEVARLQKELAAKPAAQAEVVRLHPVMSLNDPVKIAERERELMAQERWLLENFDGVEAQAATGTEPAVPAYSAEQVRKRYAQVKEERETWIPRARAALEQRRQCDAAAQQFYPELFKSGTTESAVLQNVLTMAPGLASVFPSIATIIGDAIVGERVRLAKAKGAAGTKVTPGTNGKPLAAAAKVAPKLPVHAAPARPAKVAAAKATGVPSEAAFHAAGGGRNGLLAAIRSMGEVPQVRNLN